MPLSRMDLTYLPPATEGHMTPTPEVINLWLDVKKRTNFKHLLEIGTNAGHSAAIVMTLFPDVLVTSVDIGIHPYVYEAADGLYDRFGYRFRSVIMDSKEYFRQMREGQILAPQDFDLMNIDGDHSVEGASSDLQLAKFLNVPHILLDDFRMYGVPEAFAQHGDGLEVLSEYEYNYRRELVTIALLKNDAAASPSL